MFANDSNSYVLCKYNTKNLIGTQIAFYISIEDTFEYIISTYKQKENDFYKKYMLHQDGCVFNFEYEQNIYELYKVEKNSNYVLIIFDLETNLINFVEGFNNEKNALKNMKKQFENISKTYELQKKFEQNIIFNDNKIFGMTSKCIKRFCDLTKEEIHTEIHNKFCDMYLDDITIEPKNKKQLLYEDGAYFRIITGCYKFKYYDNIYNINVEACQYFRVGFNDGGKEKTEIEIDCDESFLRDTRLTDKDIINYVGDIIEEHINEI
jgi:hypothetical protein